MNKYGLTKLAIMLPESAYRVFQATAARQGTLLTVWARRVLFEAACIKETDMVAIDPPRVRLTPAKRAILTFLETQQSYVSTLDIVHAHSYSRVTVYNNVQDLMREGLIQRGENMAINVGAGAPCKSYAITEMGKQALTDVREAIQRDMDTLQSKAQSSYDADMVSVRLEIDRDTYRDRLHRLLKYVAMHRLGREIESDRDIEWADTEHARLCGLADSDVAKGAATYEAHFNAISAKVEMLGGTDQIVARFNGV